MAAGDGVLFVDVDGDDSISSLSEYVFTEWDRTASDDMEALARVFDTSGDGRLSAADAQWDKFHVMVTNADGSTEVKRLSQLGITEINLRRDEMLFHGSIAHIEIESGGEANARTH